MTAHQPQRSSPPNTTATTTPVSSLPSNPHRPPPPPSSSPSVHGNLTSGVVSSVTSAAANIQASTHHQKQQAPQHHHQNQHQHHTNSTSINAGQVNSLAVPLPWILLNGEYLAVLHKDPLASDENQLPPSQPTYYSEIIFVMPADNRGVRGKMYITNFRLYFKSDVKIYLHVSF
jgi:hypothetical protein